MSAWKECLLGDVVNLKRGYDLPHSARSPGPFPVVSSSGITDHHSEAKVKGPGVVTGRYGTLGQVFFVETDYWPLNTSLYVQDFKGNDPRFISYFLGTLNFGSQNAAGAVPGVNRNHLHALEVHVPPLSTQRRIAGILSAYDELIENSQRRIKILESMARALYREWFVRFRFPGHESVPRVASPLGGIPQGWEVKRVPECVDINPRVTVPREGEKPFVPMGCLSNDSMLITDIESREGNSGAKFQNGDTLFARITPCLENGKTAFVQFLPNAQTVGFGSTEFIVLRSRTLTPEFVYLLARSDEFRSVAIKSMTGATGRQRVQEQCFNDFQIAQPPRALLDRFSNIIAPSFCLIDKLHLEIQNLRRTRDLLLPRLLSGQIDVEALDHA
ncbi:MAG: restriction endonuclease subunit S [Accumulibacter sp.]|uniref:restriction endonuclease subunit S n=1 Tax=Accumulibacter sp. TaxID=2053492 RepID=UPI003314766B